MRLAERNNKRWEGKKCCAGWSEGGMHLPGEKKHDTWVQEGMKEGERWEVSEDYVLSLSLRPLRNLSKDWNSPLTTSGCCTELCATHRHGWKQINVYNQCHDRSIYKGYWPRSWTTSAWNIRSLVKTGASGSAPGEEQVFTRVSGMTAFLSKREH